MILGWRTDMSASAIPEDVAAHLEAAIQLSNRRVQTRLLKEAQAVLEQNAPLAALVIASAVLESVLETVPPDRYFASAASIDQWRALRNSATHSHPSTITVEQARQVVHGICGLLPELVTPTEAGQPQATMTAGRLRGKYKHVSTSSQAFNQRKAEELDLEH